MLLLSLLGLYEKVKNTGKKELLEKQDEATNKTIEFQASDRSDIAKLSDDQLRDSVLADRNKLLQDR